MHEAPKHARRWFRFGLTAMLVAVAGVSCAVNWIRQQIEARRVVTEFCHQATSSDRGIVNSPFAGPTDGRIALLMVLNEPLRKRMGLSVAQVRNLASLADYPAWHSFGLSPEELSRYVEQELGESPPADSEGEVAIPKGITFAKIIDNQSEEYLFDSARQAALAHIVLGPQQDQLDILYLHAEGLVALCRPHLAARMSLSRDQLDDISKVIRKSMNTIVLPLHQAHFTINSADGDLQIALIRRRLREQSERLDQQIFALLTRKQIQKLASILQDAAEWEDLVISPGLTGASAGDIFNSGEQISSDDN